MLSGVPHLYKQIPNGQYLSDLRKMCNLVTNLWKLWIGDHRFLTYIFKWERLITVDHFHPVSIGHCVTPLYNDKKPIDVKRRKNISISDFSLGRHLCKPHILGFYLSHCVHVLVVSFGWNAILYHIISIVFDSVRLVEHSPDKVEPSPDEVKSHHWSQMVCPLLSCNQ